MRYAKIVAAAWALSAGVALAQAAPPPAQTPSQGPAGPGEGVGAYPPCSLKVQDHCTVQAGHMQTRKRTSRLTPLQRGEAAARSASAHPAAAAAYGTPAAPKGSSATNPPAGGAR